MTIDSIWMIIVGVSVPLAGVVAFYIQLKGIKHINLKNEKLYLELKKLKEENRKLESQIKIPTDEEVKKYGRPDVLFSANSLAQDKDKTLFSRFINIDWRNLLIAILIVGFIGYFFYDIYRVGLWLLSLF